MTDLPWTYSPVLPVVRIEDTDHAVPVARALVAGGISVIEIVLRTQAALASIELIRREVPEIWVGAGTLVRPGQANEAADAGAQFLVSPGCPRDLCSAMIDTGLPALPGASTVTELMELSSRGFQYAKVFPADAAGNTSFIRSVGSVLPGMKLCPSGGISHHAAASYLMQPNVSCVGGSWLTPNSVVKSRNWKQIATIAAQAAALSSLKPTAATSLSSARTLV
ncbi:2-dehydro-3-deoxyphosphogluconate aldolase/(4S)-4-hydroxy-2-oxoglutarate aldolase [Rhodococcus sp. LBL1]|uniref:2-dehydro-3-deoxyphosphogluconate aldolase/(4S)-4-hydroxy-2-oxoglutarate aldolase n=1 Tax=Prescottella agglutinans TaxID=1644129 RepID=A0ABT6MHW5_9NOCA|nr:2-dehydro-3-deoxyphosphogluconate aldolase/(4S)-4-hydroxy-2-oxoglutarate aldolase [Prescottella agglutinans]MDH6677316.1 2-dehydro-3-deoxyphosphogluconate aldolase/(4S)-4-hydroxy-2-oxoglutarate aldolase [Rhodococcus sp. LBL1]MDH6682390.1 2-dehydro-3-deoxyphosphogluconate aldolase/(4S)-4-hydroxy-2-oxoglutarate aldolase [Rhodococcus sp. LBL2]